MTVADLLSDVLGDDVPVAFRAYDGSSFGPSDARTTIVVRSPDALRRIVTAPDELGFGRAYVAGELEVDGDMFDVMAVANYRRHRRRRGCTAGVIPASETPPPSRTTTTSPTTSTGWCSGRR